MYLWKFTAFISIWVISSLFQICISRVLLLREVFVTQQEYFCPPPGSCWFQETLMLSAVRGKWGEGGAWGHQGRRSSWSISQQLMRRDAMDPGSCFLSTTASAPSIIQLNLSVTFSASLRLADGYSSIIGRICIFLSKRTEQNKQRSRDGQTSRPAAARWTKLALKPWPERIKCLKKECWSQTKFPLQVNI